MAKETGSPMLLFENVDLTPIHSILWTDLHRDGPGRPVEYQPEWDRGRDLGQGSRVDLRLFYPQFSTDSHLLGENKVNRNPLGSFI